MGSNKSPLSLRVNSPAPPRSTSKKRRRTIMDDGEVEGQSSPSGKPPRDNKTRNPNAPSIRGIPRSYDEASHEDRKLLRWRDNGMEWANIRELWVEMTGEEVAPSTLPNRYERLKVNFVGMLPDDQVRMLEAKREIESAFDEEKWNLIALAVEQKGGGKHSVKDLRREYRKLMEKNGLRPPKGIAALDFEDPKPLDEPDTSTGVDGESVEEE